MNPLDAYHLPGLDETDVAGWDTREFAGGEVRLRFPVLEPRALHRLLDRLARARAEHLADRPVAGVVEAIDAAARRLADPDDPHRRLAERALPAVTGYSPPMVRLILDRMAADWRKPALDALLRAELGDPGVLDGFRPAPGRDDGARIRAFGPGLAFHIFAGNVPGVAVTSLVRSLLLKAATLGKTASGDPLLPALFARALAQAAPALGECLAVTYWPGGSIGLEEAAFAAADAVVVYGGAEVVESVRSRAPVHARLVEHGPRLSFAVVAREALEPDTLPATADAAARAVATFDQQGCVSPHVIYVEDGGAASPRRFAATLADAMRRIERELPRGRIAAAEATAIQQARGAAEFRALAGTGVRLHASAGTEFTVIYDPDPAFDPSCLNRLVRVKPLERLADAADVARPYARYLQTVGVAGPEARRRELADRLGAVGACRIADLERMPWPPPPWHHDGREPLRELIRWVDLEE